MNKDCGKIILLSKIRSLINGNHVMEPTNCKKK
jgi:hypothetical protein